MTEDREPQRPAASATGANLSGLRRSHAWLLIVSLSAATAALTLYAYWLPSSEGPRTSGGDLETYAAIVDRMRAGEYYYAAARTELIEGGYGISSVLNWRTPLYPYLLSWSPSTMVAQSVLVLLAIAAGAAAVGVLARTGSRSARWIGAFALAFGLLSTLISGTVMLVEVTTGVVILLSVSLYGLDRRFLGAATALAALFLRELAAVYLLICVALALKARRWKELSILLAGTGAYAAYFTFHALEVRAHSKGRVPSYDDGWVQFGGLDLVLRTAHFNGGWSALPLTVTAFLLPLTILALVARGFPGSTRAAATVIAYALLFAVVGKPFNYYWGAIYTPLMALGLAMALAAVRQLTRAARSASGRPSRKA